VAKVPDERLDRLAALYNPKKLTHAPSNNVDVGAIGQEALKESAYVATCAMWTRWRTSCVHLRTPPLPHVGPVDPPGDIKNVDFDLMVSTWADRKAPRTVGKGSEKMRTPELEKEFDLLKRANTHLGTERPLT